MPAKSLFSSSLIVVACALMTSCNNSVFTSSSDGSVESASSSSDRPREQDKEIADLQPKNKARSTIKDEQLLQGEWKLLARYMYGPTQPGWQWSEPEELILGKFSGSILMLSKELSCTTGPSSWVHIGDKGTFRIDASKRPKRIGKRSAISRQLSAKSVPAMAISFQEDVEIFVFWLKADS